MSNSEDNYQGAEFEDETSFANMAFEDGATFEGARFGNGVSFEGAEFGNQVSFEGAEFGDDVSFEDATFGELVSFNDAVFGGKAGFTRATFGNGVGFDRVTFKGMVTFIGANFGVFAQFRDATFHGGNFSNAVIGPATEFRRATFGPFTKFTFVQFGEAVVFNGARFKAADFGRARFGDDASFDGVHIGDEELLKLPEQITTILGGASFRGVTFGDRVRFGPMAVGGWLDLRQAVFGIDPELRISADRLFGQGMRFPDGGRIRVRWAEIALDGANFAEPSTLEAAPPFEHRPREPLNDAEEVLDESAVVAAIDEAARSYRTERPRPVALTGCDVSNLVLSGVDLGACRFTDSHHLAELRLEGPTVFPSPPRHWHVGWTVSPLWRWSPRRTIVEEHYWRSTTAKSEGWLNNESPNSPSPHVAAWHAAGKDRPAVIEPGDIARLYRELRRGLEDNKDEPGAADFYYGEMEMRRHASTTPPAERLVLWLYWFVSGYALRASRALACLASVLVLATVLLAAVGFPDPRPQTTTLTGTIGTSPPQPLTLQSPSVQPKVTSASSLQRRLDAAWWIALEGAVYRTSELTLTDNGRHVQTVLRFIGPLLLGLTLLSVRGRVKR